jgi:hypothetical protein
MQRTGDLASTIEGYLLIPHELLHVAAYRLIGKPCRYVWGRTWVRGLVPLSRRERLFVLLFPLVATLATSLGLYAVSFAALLYVIMPQLSAPVRSYWQDVPLWHFGLMMLALLCMAYGGSTATLDLVATRRLLFRARPRENADQPQADASRHSQAKKFRYMQ